MPPPPARGRPCWCARRWRRSTACARCSRPAGRGILAPAGVDSRLPAAVRRSPRAANPGAGHHLRHRQMEAGGMRSITASALQAEGLKKHYGERAAVADVSLSMRPGEIIRRRFGLEADFDLVIGGRPPSPEPPPKQPAYATFSNNTFAFPSTTSFASCCGFERATAVIPCTKSNTLSGGRPSSASTVSAIRRVSTFENPRWRRKSWRSSSVLATIFSRRCRRSSPG